MQWIRGFRFLLVAASVALAAGLSQNAVTPKKAASGNEIAAALKTGLSVVVVIRPSDKPGDGEAYADWAEYLNQFAAREKSVKIVKLSQQRYAELAMAPKLTRPYDTLFLRDAGNALLYRGMILEPEIYKIGKAYMTAASRTEPIQREGLEEVKLQLRP